MYFALITQKRLAGGGQISTSPRNADARGNFTRAEL